MFKRLATTMMFSLLALPAAAQCVGESYLDQLSEAERADLAAATAEIPYGKGLLWTATKGEDTATIAGTMHIYDARLEPIRAQIKDQVQSADLVMVEATLDDQKTLQEMIITQPDLLFITEGPTLPDLVDEETWDLIADASTARSIPGFMAAKMQPWYLSMMLSIPPCAMENMIQGQLGLDHMVMEDATAADVPLQGLEPVTTLFEIFENEPIDDQIAMLLVNLLAPETLQQLHVAMLDRYFEGDIATLWEMTRIAMNDMPGITPEEAADLFSKTEEGLLNERNRNWMPVINAAFEDHDNIVIAAGAAHLIGEQGILQFLEDDGWTVTPLQ